MVLQQEHMLNFFHNQWEYFDSAMIDSVRVAVTPGGPLCIDRRFLYLMMLYFIAPPRRSLQWLKNFKVFYLG